MNSCHVVPSNRVGPLSCQPSQPASDARAHSEADAKIAEINCVCVLPTHLVGAFKEN
jgi:hypothetical protein